MENIEYKDFLENCQTGDLLLYSSKRWYSYIIEFLGWSKYSHVSMIVRDPIWIDPNLKGLYIFESGVENTNDVIEDRHVYGVQLVKLEDALKNYRILSILIPTLWGGFIRIVSMDYRVRYQS